MFENIAKFFKKLMKAETKETHSKDTAKERLHLVLMQDRANVSADFLELMKQEIIEVIKKYIDVEESAIDVRLTNEIGEDGTQGAPSLYANIPIINIKNDMKNKVKKENEELNKENKKEEEKIDKENNNKKDTETPKENEDEIKKIDNEKESKEEKKDKEKNEEKEDESSSKKEESKTEETSQEKDEPKENKQEEKVEDKAKKDNTSKKKNSKK